MRGGFSFCGVDIADIGLEYAPDNKDTYVYAPAESNIHEETFEGHDGGYSYGASKQPKEFILRCYYENKHIAQGVMAKALDLFRVGKKGMLIFKRRPWCYYYATVTARPDISEMYSYLNGLITITMKTYYPYARGLPVVNPVTKEEHLFYNVLTDPYHEEVMRNTAMFDKDYMMPRTTFNTSALDNRNNELLLYNPGTERAKVDILVTGKPEKDDQGHIITTQNVIITNKTTNQSCRYVNLNLISTSGIYTDGITGKTVLTSFSADYTANLASTDPLSFLYHDYGFIELEPAYPIIRDIYVTNVDPYEGASAVTVLNMLYQDEDEKEWYIGKYIFLGKTGTGKWCKINKCIDEHRLEVITGDYNPPVEYKTNIVLMNEIHVARTATGNGASIKLAFIYKPTYS